MRPAIIAALLADPALGEVVGARVYGRTWSGAGLSRELTPGAFSPDGDLLPSLVVVLEARRNAQERHRPSPDRIVSVQSFAVWALSQGPGYEDLKAALRHARRVLHRQRLEPVEDPIVWSDTLWTDTSPETLDPALQVPAMVSRFAATITEEL